MKRHDINPHSEIRGETQRRGERTLAARYDWVVVGAGSAGCTVAAQLARRGRVLVVEAGARYLSTACRRPADYVKRFRSSDDWDLVTTPQEGLAGRVLPFPRGRGAGGSTRINASIWIDPCEETLAALERAGGDDWSAERLGATLAEVRRAVAPEPPRWLSAASAAFLSTAERLGYAPRAFERMNLRGHRRTAADVFLGDIDTATDCEVETVLLCDQRAAGVSLRTCGGIEKVMATRGVVLAAGAIHTPAILQRSGIGPREVLRRAGVEVRVAAERAGLGLQDHLVVPTVLAVPEPYRFPGRWSMRQLARWGVVGRGPATSNLAECGMFVGQGEGRLQVFVTPTDYLKHPQRGARAAMTIAVTQSSPRSRGRVWIEGPSAASPPRIDPAYLAEGADREALARGVELAEQLAACEPLGSWRAGMGGTSTGSSMEVEGRAGKRRERRITRTALSLYHPCGGCSMGVEKESVVDSRLRVRGVESLWIVDASILPGVPIANPNPLVMAAAFHCAEWID